MVYKCLCYTKNKSQCWHTVIPGQDQGSNQTPSRMQQVIKTEEQKNFSNKVAGKNITYVMQVNDTALLCR